ncbi:MAG: hypothetical protein LW720_13845 [Pirellula sp.]|nr:hypothetical protein [Pirellula sp.]
MDVSFLESLYKRLDAPAGGKPPESAASTRPFSIGRRGFPSKFHLRNSRL